MSFFLNERRKTNTVFNYCLRYVFKDTALFFLYFLNYQYLQCFAVRIYKIKNTFQDVSSYKMKQNNIFLCEFTS